jgi:hypothetical protein
LIFLSKVLILGITHLFRTGVQDIHWISFYKRSTWIADLIEAQFFNFLIQGDTFRYYKPISNWYIR